MRFSAKGLPAGVTFDTAKGILGGIAPEKKGDYDITVTAENAKGKASRVISLAVGGKIALTPPMGWNSWNTHVSLWCMIGSPLLIGCDLTTMDAFTRNLLANDAVIAVSQDRLGKVARRIRHVDSQSVWVRPLADGATAVALVNRSPIAREISVSFLELGLGSGEHWVKDLWRQKCEGKHAGTYVAQVPPHATKLIYVKSVACPKCE